VKSAADWKEIASSRCRGKRTRLDCLNPSVFCPLHFQFVLSVSTTLKYSHFGHRRIRRLNLMRYLRLEQYMQKEILAMPAHIVILKRSLGPYSEPSPLLMSIMACTHHPFWLFTEVRISSFPPNTFKGICLGIVVG
jgi:hypothetical protein